ncbi:MAG TPA: hypothetical protein VLH77_02530 [Gammaproteobacteria bacterium]|nr:hypothetical protein [Gammaproteobacteria bacterium]
MQARLLRGERRGNRRNTFWQNVVLSFSILGDASNVGILFEMLRGWSPRFALILANTPLGYLAIFMDPLIYFFRAMMQFTKLICRKCLNIQFEEEATGPTHPWQTVGSVLSFACFVWAIILFSGVLTASPVGITLAWVSALSGLSCVSFFDYHWPERQAYNKYLLLLEQPETSNERQVEAYQHYLNLKKARQLHVSVLIGLSLLLICSSAIVFAPPVLVPFLALVSNVGSLILVGLCAARFYNWLRAGKNLSIQRESGIEMQTMEAKAEPGDRPRLQLWRSPRERSSSSPSQGGLFRQNMHNLPLDSSNLASTEVESKRSLAYRL